MGQGTYGVSECAQVEPWDYLYLPSAGTVESDLALGLFREGMSVNSVPFAFLSFFKVLNIKYGAGGGQKDWINNNLEHLWYSPAVDRLNELRQVENDIGKYLYEEGRCAVAHAHGNPLVNPDNYSDKRRMENDLKLMQELAALFIEKELGVLSDGSFWKSLGESHLGSSRHLLKKVEEDGRIVYQCDQ